MYQPVNLWKIFQEICRIPHASGNEAALRLYLKELAEKNGLAACCDEAGNLRIDRAAAPGHENAPRIIMQGHLDMVPQKTAENPFDFSRDAIGWLETDGWLRSACGTTLGADNGIGVAEAMSLLLDKNLQTGPLAGLFTFSEETGLTGAKNLEEKMLTGDVLLNFDDEDENEFCIGCAGGCRMNFQLPLAFRATPDGMTGVKLSVSGLAGGHSGSDIDKNRGNAILILAEILRRTPQFSVSSIDGGTLDNVIPGECSAAGVVPADQAAAFSEKCGELAAAIGKTLAPESRLAVTTEFVPLPETVWLRDLQQKVLSEICSCPAGVIEYDDANQVPVTSCNFAAIHTRNHTLHLLTMHRSSDDAKRDALTVKLQTHFAGAQAEKGNEYPGWKPAGETELLRRAKEACFEIFQRQPEIRVIHGGLECGIFAGKNPKLEMLSMGPTIQNAHSVEERVSIASVERFDRMVRKLLENF